MSTLIIIIGLIVFEVISSADNAVINANVLKTMNEKYRKIFLFWGVLFAVFVVRGVLPFFIVWLSDMSLSAKEVIILAFSGNMGDYVRESKPLLVMSGGVYLILLSLNWLFCEKKNYALKLERWFQGWGIYHPLVMALLLGLIITSSMVIPIIFGALAFYLVEWVKKYTIKKKVGAWGKIIYLEMLDASFSIDGVVGAFAFTVSVPLILIGNGIGAFVVRQLTIKGIDLISKYKYLKNGAMYSIGLLGGLMVVEAFGVEMPFWLMPLMMFIILGYFLRRSLNDNSLAV